MQCKKCGWCTTSKMGASNHVTTEHKELQRQSVITMQNVDIHCTFYERDGTHLTPYIDEHTCTHKSYIVNKNQECTEESEVNAQNENIIPENNESFNIQHTDEGIEQLQQLRKQLPQTKQPQQPREHLLQAKQLQQAKRLQQLRELLPQAEQPQQPLQVERLLPAEQLPQPRRLPLLQTERLPQLKQPQSPALPAQNPLPQHQQPHRGASLSWNCFRSEAG